MNAGKLSSLVTIQQKAVGQEPDGQPVNTWTDVASVWADIRHLNGIETVKATALTPVVKASIRIRYRTGINSGMRVVHGQTVYNITAVLPDVAKKECVDLACEVVSG
ncbi:MAG TPA: phage head closure protein [Noviherbaspirillum sp.]|nr:phage head closure protein [Noviherbaspirillum sp.]